MSESEPRPTLVVDFGDVLLGRILDLSKSLGIPKSRLVRAAVEHYLDGSYYDILREKKKLGEETKKLGKREEVSKIVDCYNTVYYSSLTPPKQFYPALYKVYNNAVKGGLSTDEMLAIVEASPAEDLVAKMLREGKTPSLPYLLSSGMIPRIMVVAHGKQVKEEKMSESDFIEFKYDTLDDYIDKVSSKLRDSFRDKLMEASNHGQVIQIVKEYT